MEDYSAFDDILATTRSVRRRIDFDRPVPPEVLLECIDIAVQAPTGVGPETWRFVVITDDDKKRSIAELYRQAFDDYMRTRFEELKNSGDAPDELSPNYRYLADNLQNFPALILVCREGRPPQEHTRQVAFYGSILPAAWSLMLALRTRGLGATWTTLLSSYEKQAAEILEMPSYITSTVLLPIGYMNGAKLKRATRTAARRVTYWDKWGRDSI